MKIRILSITFSLLLMNALSAFSATQEQIDQAWNKSLAWIMSHQSPNGGWSSPPGLEVQTASEVVQLLASVGLRSTYTFMGTLSWLSNADPANVDGLARQGSALRTAGEDVVALSNKLIAWRNYLQGWGAYPQYGSSLPDTPIAIIALMDCLGTTYSNYEAMNAVRQFLAAQAPAPDYSWSYMGSMGPVAPPGQRRGAIIPTVYAILALHKLNTTPGRFTSVTINQTTYSLSTAITNALSGLLLKRKSDNGFGDGAASTLIETALAYQAFKLLLPNDPVTMGALDYLIAQQSNSGDWEGNALHTAIVASSLPSPTPLVDTDRDGVPDGVEALLGLNPVLADSRSIASGPVTTSASALPQGTTALSASSPTQSNAIQGSPSFMEPPVDAELFIAGTSAEMEVIDSIIMSLFRTDHPIDRFYDDGGSAGEIVGESFRGYLGVIEPIDAGPLEGKRVLINFRAKGGSYNGVWPVALSTPIDKLLINEACVDEDGDRNWSCPLANTALAVPDAGISEVGPEFHVGENVPKDQIEPDPLHLDKLDCEPVFSGHFGIAATRALLESGLRSLRIEEIKAILSGSIENWEIIDQRFSNKPVVICRMPDGAQPAANALFLDIPCDQDASSAYISSQASGYLVIESNCASDLARCLNTAHNGGYIFLKNPSGIVYVPADSFGVGVLPISRQPGINDRYAYLSLMDRNGGVLPESSIATVFHMQWIVQDIEQASTAENKLALLREIRIRLSSPEFLEPHAGVAPFDPTNTAAAPGCKEVAP